MDYEVSDSSGTDDDLPASHQNRFSRVGRASGNGRSTDVASARLPRIHNDMESQIHLIEKEAYCGVLRSFKAQSDAITWEKESLITELRKELRISDEEHRELLSKVNSDEAIRRIRDWRKAGGSGMPNTSLPFHEHSLPSPTVSASRKKQKTALSSASLSIVAPPSTLHSSMQPSSSDVRRGPPSGVRGKKSKPHLSAGEIGRVPVGSTGTFMTNDPADDSLVGKKVWTRWPEDNSFYEAVITDYNPLEGRHALVYDVNTTDETWEWVNLKEISPNDIRWDGEDPSISRRGSRPGTAGRGVKRRMSRGGAVSSGGRGRGNARHDQTNKDFPLSQNGIGKKTSGHIEILHTDTLIKKLEKVFGAAQPDPEEIVKARKVLDEHEQALINAIARLEAASDGESDGERPFSRGQPLHQNA